MLSCRTSSSTLIRATRLPWRRLLYNASPVESGPRRFRSASILIRISPMGPSCCLKRMPAMPHMLKLPAYCQVRDCGKIACSGERQLLCIDTIVEKMHICKGYTNQNVQSPIDSVPMLMHFLLDFSGMLRYDCGENVKGFDMYETYIPGTVTA